MPLSQPLKNIRTEAYNTGFFRYNSFMPSSTVKISLKIAASCPSKPEKSGVVYSVDSPVIKFICWDHSQKIPKEAPQDLEVESLYEEFRDEKCTGLLIVEFVSGDTYKFYGVPEYIFEAFLNREPGVVFNEYVRNNFSPISIGYHKLSKQNYKVADVYTEKDESNLEALSSGMTPSKIEKIGVNNIAYVYYDSDEKTFSMEFNNGNCYLFEDVSKSIYDEFIKSPFKGSFYNEKIKSKFKFKVLDPVSLSEMG